MKARFEINHVDRAKGIFYLKSYKYGDEFWFKKCDGKCEVDSYDDDQYVFDNYCNKWESKFRSVPNLVGAHLHRDDDLPAITRICKTKYGGSVTSKRWYIDGKLHRNGVLPASVDSCGLVEWYKKGEKIDNYSIMWPQAWIVYKWYCLEEISYSYRLYEMPEDLIHDLWDKVVLSGEPPIYMHRLTKELQENLYKCLQKQKNEN